MKKILGIILSFIMLTNIALGANTVNQITIGDEIKVTGRVIQAGFNQLPSVTFDPQDKFVSMTKNTSKNLWINIGDVDSDKVNYTITLTSDIASVTNFGSVSPIDGVLTDGVKLNAGQEYLAFTYNAPNVRLNKVIILITMWNDGETATNTYEIIAKTK